MIEFKSGAKSSEIKPAVELFPIEGILYGSERMGVGAKEHGPENYMKGVNDDAFILERKRHLVIHALNYLQGRTTPDGDTPIDHLKAVLANGAMLARIEEARKVIDSQKSASSVAAAGSDGNAPVSS